MSYTLLLLNVLAIKYITSINDSQESTKIDSFQNKLASTIIPAAGISKEFDADEKLFSFSENGLFVGYYHDHYWNDLNGFAFNLSHSEDPNTCFNMCENKGFEYAAIRFINSLYFACFCDNKYGTSKITNTNIQHISTFCSSFPIKCGKNSFNKVVNVKERNTNMEVIGTVSGCYSIKMYSNYSYVDSQSSCLKNCLEKSLKTAVLNLENHCICEGFYDGLENNEDLNCPNCTNENCAKYNGFLLNASYNEMEIRCPKTAFTGLEFNCSVTIKKPSEYTVIIDFGTQNKSLVINAVKFPFDFTVNYSSPGHYLLKVNVENHKINVQTTIYVYDDDNSILTIDEKKEFIYKEKGIYLGCFYDQNYFYSKNEEIRSFNENNMTTEFCFDNCKEADYQYAILKNSFECYCSNKYGMEGVRKDHECNCVCFGKLEDFCGCRNTYRVYSLKNKRTDSVYTGSYLGCFEATQNNKQQLTFTNLMCLKICKDFRYFLTQKKDFCSCIDSIEGMVKISDYMCDIPCSGNSTQICGSFLGSSVYEISLSKLDFKSEDFVKVNQEFNCMLQLTSKNTIDLRINFGDELQTITLAPNSSYNFTKNYSISAYHQIVISSSNSSLEIYPTIFISEQLDFKNYSEFLIDTVEIFENSVYAGCFDSFKAQSLYYNKILNNEICSEYCSLRDYQFSTVNTANLNGQCKCARQIRSRKLPLNLDTCLCMCPESPNYFCSCFGKSKMQLKVKNFAVMFFGTYLGCFESKDNSIGVAIGFLNNHLCIQYCIYSNFKYASSVQQNKCLCSNDTLMNAQLDENFCSMTCNGNQSQICGGLKTKSVYEIKKFGIRIDCPKKVLQYENFNCVIRISFEDKNESYFDVFIDFGDKTYQKLTIQPEENLNNSKIYKRSGNFKVEATIIGTVLHVTTFIESVPNFYLSELNLKGEYGYIGCFFDREPFEFSGIRFISKNNMKNNVCSEICNIYSFKYSATYLGYECSCSNFYGTYNIAQDLECKVSCSGSKDEYCGGKKYIPFTVYESDIDTLAYSLKKECTTINLTDLQLIKKSNPISDCKNKGKPITILNENEYFCSERNYSVRGLDYSRALCDRTCLFDEHFECGGSPYYLRSVSNFNIKSPEITGDFYFEFLGCFTLNTPDDYLILENTTITTCFKYCSYLNLTMVASGKYCFCLQSINMTLRVGENNCSNYKVFDRHYSGQNTFYGVYKIIGFNKTGVPNQNGKYSEISFRSSYFHRVITEAFEANATCFNFCLFEKYKYFAFDQQKRICYCGSWIDFSVTNVETFIYTYTYESSEFSTFETSEFVSTSTLQSTFSSSTSNYSPTVSESFNSISKTTNYSVLGFDSTIINTTENSTIEQVKNAFYDSDPIFLAEILNTANYDISGCLVNCSNKGFCSFTGNKYKCICKDQYYGSSCEKTINPCDQKIQCLNNGTCVFIKNDKLGFRCECSTYYYGSHCENAIDLCQNVTCSGNGFCQEDKNKEPKCKCFKYYKGDHCEETEPVLQTIKTVIRTSMIIAVVVIILSFLSILSIDIVSFLMKKKS